MEDIPSIYVVQWIKGETTFHNAYTDLDVLFDSEPALGEIREEFKRKVGEKPTKFKLGNGTYRVTKMNLYNQQAMDVVGADYESFLEMEERASKNYPAGVSDDHPHIE